MRPGGRVVDGDARGGELVADPVGGAEVLGGAGGGAVVEQALDEGVERGIRRARSRDPPTAPTPG